MSVVILHRGTSYSCEYHNWLEDCNKSIILVISVEMNQRGHCKRDSVPNAEFYSDIVFLTEYDDVVTLNQTLTNIAARDPISTLISHFEFDLIRAADMRQKMDISGQMPDSANVFRDKLQMKTCADQAGLIGYRFAPISEWADVAEFHGAPREVGAIILKPRAGSKSLGILRVDDPVTQREEIESLLNEPFMLSPEYMVEDFVEGEVFHVDGLVLAGELRLIWPSQYITGSLEFQGTQSQTISSAMLPPDSDLCARLNAYVSAVVTALPTPDNCNIHCEVFVTPGGRIELCEIASRIGGVRIKHGLARAFNFDIAEAWARAEVGLPQRVSKPPSQPTTLTGWATMAGRDGTVASIPDDCDIQGVYGYQRTISIGDPVQAPGSAVDYIANCDIEGPNQEAIITSIRNARAWFDSQFSVS